MENNETKKGYPVSPQDSQKDNQVENVPSNAIIPYNDVLVKNRKLGRVKGYLERNQRIAYNAFLKFAYDTLLQDPNQLKFIMGLREFLSFTKLDYESYHSHLFKDTPKQKSLKTLLKELQTKTYEIEWRDEKDEPYRVLSASLLSQFIMDRDKDYIEFEFPSAIREAILTKQNFYILHFPIMNSIRSTYSIALYEQIAQRKEFGIWRVSAKDFRELMGVEKNKYKLTRDFHDFVLYPAVQGINEVIPIDLRVKKIKQGRSIVAYEFTWDTEKFEHEISQLYKHTSNTSIIQPVIVQSTPQSEIQPEQSVSQPDEPALQPQSETQPTSGVSPEVNTLLELLPENLKDIQLIRHLLTKYNYEDVRDAILCALEHKANNLTAYVNALLENPLANLSEFRAKLREQEEKRKQEQEKEQEKKEKEEQERKQQRIENWWEQRTENYMRNEMNEIQRKMLRNSAIRAILAEYPKYKTAEEIPNIFIEIKEKAIIREQLQAEGVKPPEDL